MDNFWDFVYNPTIFVAIFIGASVLLLLYILNLFKNETERNNLLEKSNKSEKPNHYEKKSVSANKSKKKIVDNRWSNRGGDKGFNHPWLLTSLKGHTGQVLDIDFSSSGKYLASCGEEDPDPDPEMNIGGDSSSNKENSCPSSADPSPRITKGLSRRQRKNRRRDDNTPADFMKKIKPTTKTIIDSAAVIAAPVTTTTTTATMFGQKQYNMPPLNENGKINLTPNDVAHLLQIHLLNRDQLIHLGYPIEAPFDKNSAVFFNYYHNRSPMVTTTTTTTTTTTAATTTTKQSKFDVNAREFVPGSNTNLEKMKDEWSSENSSETSSDPGDVVDDSDRISTTSSSSSSSASSSEQDSDNKSDDNSDSVECKCVRCGHGFFITDKVYLTKERCIHHWGKLHTIHPGDQANGIASLQQYSCCYGKPGSAGCTTSKLHVWSGIIEGFNGPLKGFVKTRYKKSMPIINGNYGIYALDCEMCFTIKGLEVTKVTIVGLDGKLVYDSYIRPKNKIIDYNTRFSGITAKDLYNKTNTIKSLKQVQNDLMGFINANTILIGHGLENDLRALKIIHKCIVDTSYVFPHYIGLPFKRSLKSLVSAYLHREVQNDPNGHNSFEDACACMELMLWRIRQDYYHRVCR